MKILFVSYDASRTGAPLLLLQLIKWLKRVKNDEIDLESRKSEYGWLVLKEEKIEFLKNEIAGWDSSYLDRNAINSFFDNMRQKFRYDRNRSGA